MYQMTDHSSFIIKNVPAEWKTFTIDFTKRFGDYNDLSGSNFMQRSNGELVLTDPIYDKNGKTAYRYRSSPRSVSSLRNDPDLVWC